MTDEKKMKIMCKWCNEGEPLFKLGKYEEAIKCFVQAIKINADMWYNRSGALAHLAKQD